MTRWHQSLARFAWPLAFVVVFALVFVYFERGRQLASGESLIKVKSTATVVRDLREVARLEALVVHVEKIIDVSDEQKVLLGQVNAHDSLLFVAAGEVTLGVDLGKLQEGDVSYDAATQRASITLPPLETFHARLDEEHSYVHTRKTDLLAARNERLEGQARKLAVQAFERAAGDAALRARAQAQAESSLRALARSLGVQQVTFQWRSADPER